LELHLPILLGGVVYYARAEHRFHEAVHLVLGQHVVARLEERLLRFWADEEGQSLVEELPTTMS
jgi:hypothetical protein